MEELPDSKKTRGIFDRSFVFNFVVGHVEYNIKDVITNAGDPKFKPLYDELVRIHKLLFAYRLIHYNDIIPDIQINLENRNAELTKPTLRLFASRGDSQKALNEIRRALSKFIVDKNELKSNSIESKLCIVINELIKERDENLGSQDYRGLDDCAFRNDQIWNKCRIIMDGIDIVQKSESFYSIDYGVVTHKKIISLIRSKFKAIPFKTNGDNSKRGWRFQREFIDRLALHYTNEIKEIIIHPDTHKTASDASDASQYKNAWAVFNENKDVGVSCPPPDTRKISSSEPAVAVEQSDNNSDKTEPDIGGSTTTNSGNNNNNNNNNDNNNDNDDDGDSNNNLTDINNYNKKYNIIEINHKDNSSSLLASALSVNDTVSTVHPNPRDRPNQTELYSKIPYRHLKCDASDASDAPYSKSQEVGKTKGFPEIPCLLCTYKDPQAFDLSLHYLEKHRQYLITLPIGKCSIDNRADYAVELSKKKLFDSLGAEAEDGEDNYEDEDASDDDE